MNNVFEKFQNTLTAKDCSKIESFISICLEGVASYDILEPLFTAIINNKCQNLLETINLQKLTFIIFVVAACELNRIYIQKNLEDLEDLLKELENIEEDSYIKKRELKNN